MLSRARAHLRSVLGPFFESFFSSSTTSPAANGSPRWLNDGQPNHFISVAEWDKAESRDTWKATPEFGKLHKSMVEKCDEFVGGNFEEHVTI